MRAIARANASVTMRRHNPFILPQGTRSPDLQRGFL